MFDSSETREPLEFTVGEGQVIPGFEDAVRDMNLNDEKTVKINPEQAYGQKMNQLIMQVPRDKFPAELNIEVGGRLVLKSPEGQNIPAVVSEVKKDVVVIDMNHPLAGKELTFKIKIVEVK